MSEDWKLEAVHEQFDVFDSLKKPYHQVALDDLRSLNAIVGDIICKHLRIQSEIPPIRKISAEIIKNVPDSSNDIKFTFVVLVLDQNDDRGRLHKMPIFAVVSGNQLLYVDLNCSVYKNWKKFLESNELPDCQFCFPVDGHYKVGGQLKIEYATSPATPGINWKLFVGGGVVCVAAIAASFFFKIPQNTINFARELIKIAEKFIPELSEITQFLNLASLIQKLRNGSISTTRFLLNLYPILERFIISHKDMLLQMWFDVKCKMVKIYNLLFSKFGSYFRKSSNIAQHKFLAIMYQTDNEMSILESSADQQLKTLKMNVQSVDDTTIVSGSQTNSVFDSLVDETQLTYEKLFEKCQNDCALHIKMKDNDSQSFQHYTQDLIDVSKEIAEKLKVKTLSELQDIIEAVSSIAQKVYKNKINFYEKSVNAARAGAGHVINLDAFNTFLGISGDPKHYYWKETIEYIHNDYLKFYIKDKVIEMQKEKKIFMIPIRKESEEDFVGSYSITGIQGCGKFSSTELLCVLKENSIDIDKTHDNIMETDSMIVIRTIEYVVAVLQEINVENTSEGILCISRNSN